MKTFLSFLILVFCVLSTSAQSVDLKFNLEKNKTYRIKYISTQNSSQTVQGMEQSASTNTNMVFSLKPLKDDGDFLIAEVKFDTMITLVSAQQLEINSTNEGNLNSSDPSKIMSAIMNRLCKSTFLVKISNTGHIASIMNIEQIVPSILDGIEEIPDPIGPVVRQQVESTISESSLKGMIESITAYLAGEKVKVGDKWESNVTVSSGGFGVVSTTNYKLEDIKGNTAIISGESVIEPESKEPVMMNGIPVTFEIGGLGKSEITVDTKTGWVLEGTFKTNISGNLNANVQGNAMLIPLEISTEGKIVPIN